MTLNFIEAAESLTAGGGLASGDAAQDLQDQLAAVGNELTWQGRSPLVTGETGQAFPEVALARIAAGRPRREGGGPVSRLEAWMQAEVVAAGVVAAHETVTNEPVSPDREEELRVAFTRFALSQS